jgi:hypothetical protein
MLGATRTAAASRVLGFLKGLGLGQVFLMGLIVLLLALPSSWAQAPAFDRTSASSFDAAFQVHSACVSLHAL